MNRVRALLVVTVAVAFFAAMDTRSVAHAQEKPVVKIPDPGVPQIMTMEAKFVRAAYNNEGYVILGYQASNFSQGQDWLLLEIGTTVLSPNPAYVLKREALSLEIPVLAYICRYSFEINTNASRPFSEPAQRLRPQTVGRR